jgi:hypothetical protein
MHPERLGLTGAVATTEMYEPISIRLAADQWRQQP